MIPGHCSSPAQHLLAEARIDFAVAALGLYACLELTDDFVNSISDLEDISSPGEGRLHLLLTLAF